MSPAAMITLLSARRGNRSPCLLGSSEFPRTGRQGRLPPRQSAERSGITRLIAVSLFAALTVATRVTALDLENATIADLNAAMAKGALTSEKLPQLYLARIEAYDKQGPAINSVIVMNPKALETARALPTIKLFTTGGTIQSKGAHRGKLSEYNEARVTPQELIDDLPELKAIVKVEMQEIANIGSGGMTTELLLKLAKGINAELAKPEITGVVVTHGTGTLEETAYFLQLTVKSTKPVVVVGAMRPFTAISRDGPFNLYNAFRVAAAPEAVGQGVMVLLNDTIHSARYVTKNNTYRVETFVAREIGPIGYTDSDRVAFYRKPLVKHTAASEFDISKLDALPAVDVVYAYQEASATPIEALVAAGAKGIVLVDSSPSFNKAISLAQSKGVVVVQSDRKGSGRVLLSERTAGRGLVTADNLNGQKARILLRLALTKTSDAKEIQRIFNEY